MSLFSISSIIVSIVSILFGFLLYRGNKTEKTTVAWFYESIFVGLWAFGLYGVTSSTDLKSAMYWQYLLDVCASFIPVYYFFFTTTFLDKPLKKIYRYLSILAAIVMAGFSFSPLFKVGIKELYGLTWIDAGPYYFIFFVFYLSYMTLSVFTLFRGYHQAKGDSIRKSRIKIALFAVIISLLSGATNFFPQLFNIYPFGNYLLISYIFIMSYGVLYYKLFNVKLFSAQIFSSAIVIIFFSNLLRPSSLTDWGVNLTIFGASGVFSWFLIKSVSKEIEIREKVEILASDLEKANTRLKEIDQLKSEFVSLATHQIRGPLTSIKGYASLILEGDYGEVPTLVKDPIEKMYQSSQALVGIVQDFLDVSRIEQGKMVYDFTIFDLNALTNEVVEELRPIVTKKGLGLTFITQEKECTVKADRGKIRQVISNLIDNAMKYSQTGTIAVGLTRSYENFIVSVKDNGVGITKETMDKLFQKFSRAKDAHLSNIAGSGLGLYVAKEMIDNHKGRIWAESTGAGKGSTFLVELHRYDESQAEKDKPVINKEAVKNFAENLTI